MVRETKIMSWAPVLVERISKGRRGEENPCHHKAHQFWQQGRDWARQWKGGSVGCHSEHEGGKEGHDEDPKKRSCGRLIKVTNKHYKEIIYWELMVLLVSKVLLIRMK